MHVKLVAEVGVGTVAAGVSKAHADVVLISGHDGGTGAARLTSIKHAGAPWELGLAETQQTLLLNGLRDRIVVQVDGQLKTGRDVVIAALLGAEEFGFATAPLVVSGCVMMRVCHLDTCPVGVATQNPELRKKFNGKPEFVVNFLEFIAEEVREHLAALGFRSIAEAIGHVEMLDVHRGRRPLEGARASTSRRSSRRPRTRTGRRFLHEGRRTTASSSALDQQLIADAQDVLRRAARRVAQVVRHPQREPHGRHDARRRRSRAARAATACPTARSTSRSTGSAGQSFGAFVPRGITLRLEGDANDYLGKGLSGGTRRAAPAARRAKFVAEENIIAGNVILYGATGGEVFIRGVVGERFCVRNSGATAVVEGVGDHGCEYMTGGRAVILGPTGRNFAAGMSGGLAFVLRPRRHAVPAHEPRHGRPRPARRRGRALAARRSSRRTSRRPARPSPSASCRTGGENRRLFRKVFPKDYKRVLEAQRDAIERGVDVDEAVMAAAVDERVKATKHMGETTGFMKHGRELPTRRPIPVRIARLAGGLRGLPAGEGAHAGRALHGLRHPVLPHRLPAREPHPRVERPRVSATAGRPRPSGCTPPTTSPSSPAGCARRRAKRACVLGINEPPVTIKQIEVEIIDRAWDEGWVMPVARRRSKTGKRVAVVGSGPSGLAAAQQLTRAGHDVTVFERADRIGGLLRYGIPEFKMEKRHLDRRIEQMEAEGTEFRTNANVGRRTCRSTSCSEFDAVVLAGGATAWRDLPIPGRELRGHLPGDGVPAVGEPGAAGRHRRAADHRARQAGRDHRRRRHRRRLPRHRASARARPRCTSSRSCPARPTTASTSMPWPT